MEKAGIPRPANTHAHHIVAARSTYRGAVKARAILDKYNISVENAANGVYLRASLHQGLHTKAYYKTIANRLGRARSQRGVIRELDVIRAELLGETFRTQ